MSIDRCESRHPLNIINSHLFDYFLLAFSQKSQNTGWADSGKRAKPTDIMIVLGNWPSQIFIPLFFPFVPPCCKSSNTRVPNVYSNTGYSHSPQTMCLHLTMNYVINDIYTWCVQWWYFDMITHYKYFIMWTYPYFISSFEFEQADTTINLIKV